MNEKGQITIFYGMTLSILITLIAFVVNVGLYVKGKINLQNAVDAAAWSGAAVQARQLTNIAHMNWEMRNVYKEWMFKYYVLGQLAHPKLDTRGGLGPTPGGVLDFTLASFPDTPPDQKDLYSIPSVCIHFSGTYNICGVYNTPGLPRFESVGLPGLDLQHNQFMDAIVDQKAKDCSRRSDLNFMVANSWAYGMGRSAGNIYADVPQVAIHRPGAWPKAFELALRVRNLESIVNFPAQSNLCLGGSGCQDVSQLKASNPSALVERSHKAYMAAFRNLSGLDELHIADDLKTSLRLTELAPTDPQLPPNSLSFLLYPPETASPAQRQKPYLDLRLISLNLVSFFTAMTTSSETRLGAQAEGRCDSTKVGLPVPGYAFGFEKNPSVLTYYAVKGEAKFTGLFNPFSSATKLVAYASAKPFGGRIGPRLFDITASQGGVTARQGVHRSYHYATRLVIPTGVRGYQKGYPIPSSSNFWVRDESHLIGGSVAEAGGVGGQVRFIIPNLIYDFIPANMGAGPTYIPGISDGSSSEALPGGLYLKEQFRHFKYNLDQFWSSGPLSTIIMDKAIESLYAPTQYEAANYLIPLSGNADERMRAIDTVVPEPSDSSNGYLKHRIYAPLYGPGLHYQTIQNIQDAIKIYIGDNRAAIAAYKLAMKDVYDAIILESEGLPNPENYVAAAEFFYTNDSSRDCETMGGKFYNFFTGEGANCGSVLAENVIEGFNGYLSRSADFQYYHKGLYIPHNAKETLTGRLSNLTLATAYLPGLRQGATSAGAINHPLGSSAGSNNLGDRNFYSTKFVSIQSLTEGKPESIVGGGFAAYSEESPAPLAGFRLPEIFANPISENVEGIMQ